MPFKFHDSVDRTVTGDQAYALPPVVQVENAVASSALLESRGSRTEIEFAPKVTFDNVRELGQNNYATLQQQVASIEGTVLLEQTVLNDGNQITAVTQEVIDTPATVADAAQDYQNALGAALAGAIQEGLLMFDPVSGEIVPVPVAQEETAPPPPPPDATSAGTTEAPVVDSSGQVTQEELPVGGCETVTDVNIDEFGNPITVFLHFNGSGYDYT